MGNAALWMLRTKTNMHIQTSEYCAVGHADRTCDFIGAYILDRYLEKDPHARVGLECQLKDTFATLSGEVSSAHHFKDEELSEFVRQAITQLKAIQCAISCCIGRPDIRVTLYDDHDNLLDSQIERQPPSRVIETLSLREPLFADRCRWGLFGTQEMNY